jgi:hypothetical protein
MSKSAIAALDRLMSRERGKAIDDDNEPKHAEVRIKGDPEAVEAATHELGLPSPRAMVHDDPTEGGDDMPEEDHHDRGGLAEGGEIEHPVVAALREEHPDIHASMQRRGLC